MSDESNDHQKSTRAERVQIAAWVQSTPDPASQWIDLSVREVCTLFGLSAKTFSRARDARDKALQSAPPTPIDERSLASIDYIPPSSDTTEYRYLMSEIKAFWRRRIGAAQAAVLAEAPPVPVARLQRNGGFSEFMATAMPMDQWPFSIQEDGRPMDMFLAIEAGLLTGKAERLTLREFGTRLADASSNAFARVEADELRNASRDPAGTPYVDDWDFEFTETDP